MDNQIQGSSFVNFNDNIRIGDAVDLQDPTFSPREENSKKHLKTEENIDKTFECTTCLKILPTKHILSSHMKSHSGNPEMIHRALCNICSKTFANKYILKSHMQTHPEDEEYKMEDNKDQTFECSICSKIMSNKYILATHMKSHNDNLEAIDKALCNICSKTFANKYILKSHIQTHSEDSEDSEPVLSCNVCQKSFLNKYNLRNHKKIHDVDAKEKATALCNLCSKIMIKRTLKKHMKNIHGEKKMANCSNCGMSSKISCIKNHERMCRLSDEERVARKFKCDECGKTLSGRDKLRRHMRNIHHVEQASQEMKHKLA